MIYLQANDIQGIMEYRTRLKLMLRSAESLHEDVEARNAAIEQIKMQLLYLKLYLNSAY